MSSGTRWNCQRPSYFEVSSDCTLRSNRNDDNRYYRCNLERLMNESVETTSEMGAIEIFSRPWYCRAEKQRFQGSNTSFPVYPSIDAALDAALRGDSSLVEVLRVVGELLQLRYDEMKKIASESIDEIKNRWNATDGTYVRRAKVVNKLIGYYLVSLAIHIIELSFWTNGKLFRLLGDLILEENDNARTLIALCIVAVFVLLVHLLGEEGTLFASSVCENVNS